MTLVILKNRQNASYEVKQMAKMLNCQETGSVTNIRVPGPYIDAHMATVGSLLNSGKENIQGYAEKFKPIDLSSNEHRAIIALCSLYHEAGYNAEVFKKGVIFTPYDLCKRMGYQKDKKGRFGGKARRSALDALLSLSRRSFDIYLRRWTRKERGKNIFDVVVLPNKSLIDIQYSASNVTEEDLENGGIKGKVVKINIQIKPFFYKEGYYLLFEKNFYLRLKEILEKENRRVSKYHWNLALWLLKQKKHKKTAEINIDKLTVMLKIPDGAGHKTRARNIVRAIYMDFKTAGYIEEYKTDIPARNGKTKDILIIGTSPEKELLPGDVGFGTRGVMGEEPGDNGE